MCGLELVRSDGHNDHMKRKPLVLPANTVGVADAKRDLTSLIDRVVKSGKPVIISRRGKPVVRIEPLSPGLGLRWRKSETIPEDDPFWKGARMTEIWRRMPFTRGTRAGKTP